MKKNMLITCLLCMLTFVVISQEKRHNLVFKKNQIALSFIQKHELQAQTQELKIGEILSIFPVEYDSIYDKYKYSAQAYAQADSIASYAKTIGFDIVGIAKGFPSLHSGRSVCVTVKYSKQFTIQPESYKKESQFFTINPLEDTILNGNEGTKLYIGAGTLNAKIKVIVELKEFYKLMDYVNDDLYTVSNNRLIESGGVIYLKAYENTPQKKPVSILPNKSIGVDFAKSDNKAGMQIFLKDKRPQETLNWVLPSSKPAMPPQPAWKMTETIVDENGKVLYDKTYTSKTEWNIRLKEKEIEELNRQKQIAEQQKQAELDEIKRKKELAERLKQEEIDRRKREIEYKKQEEIARKADKIFDVSSLGLINCDRFYNEQTKNISIRATTQMSAKYYLVYSDIRSVLPGSVNNIDVSFNNIPVNKPALLIAISSNNNQAYYFSQQINPLQKIDVDIVLRAVSDDFIKQQLELLK